MNIFVLDLDQENCVKQYPDRHVVKMIVETAQLLSTAHHVLDHEYEVFPMKLYKKTHENHPCAIWARKTSHNYFWLATLGIAMCKEYTHRYGKVHKTEEILIGLRNNIPHGITQGDLTFFPLCMPDEYKEEYNGTFSFTVNSYRNYYIGEKQSLAKWTKRDKPEWFIIK